MKLLYHDRCIGENIIFMQFYVTIPEIPTFIQLALTVTLKMADQERFDFYVVFYRDPLRL